MTDATISQVAQQITQTLAVWNQNLSRQSDWLGGTASGGPNSDGRYPLLNAQGVETLVMSPARMADFVNGPAAIAELAKVSAALARDQAVSAADRAEAQRALAEAARGAAVDARNLAQTHRSFAGTSEANARYWAELAEGHGADTAADADAVQQLHDEAVAASSQAVSSAQAAATSAALAATFNPTLFDMKSDTLVASRLTGVIDIARIPVLPSQLQFVSSGGLANLTTAQQNEIGRGSIVTTTDGFRYVYSGAGSKTLAASYTVLADITPAWDSVADKPAHFPTNIANVAGLQAGLNDKVSLSTTGWQTINGALTVSNRVTMAGGDPYIGSEGPTRSVVLGGGNGWTSTGSTIVVYGVNHPSGSGNVLISAGETGIRNLSFNGFTSAQFNVRPTFGGNLAWDTGNFNPATKADANGWNSQTASYVLAGVTKSFVSGVAGGTIAGQAGAAALEVRATDANAGAAFLQFHRPGVYAANLGLDTDNQWKVGGWSMGAASFRLWHEGIMPAPSSAGAGNTTAIRDGNGILFGQCFATVAAAGNGLRFWNGDTNYAIHMSDAANGTFGGRINYTISPETSSDYNMYFTMSGGSNRGFVFRNNNANTAVVAQIDAGGNARFAGQVFAGGSFYAGNGHWFRTTGDTGWYSETYGGGVHMSDSAWVRVYNGKNLYCSAQIRGNTVVGESDRRLKTKIAPITNASAKVEALSGVTFDWLASGKAGMGFIAQDFETVLPALVTENTDGMKGVEYGPVVALLVEALKETNARVAVLESGRV